MSRLKFSWLALALVLMAVPLGAQTAETASHRRGFWMSTGFGGAARRLNCEPLCGSVPGGGTTFSLSLGGTFRPDVLLGAEIVAWLPANAEFCSCLGSDGFAGGMFSVRYYPQARSNLYVSGGLGFGTVIVVRYDLQAEGFALQGSAGYDLRVARRFSLSPYVSYLQTLGNKPTIGGTRIEGDVRFSMAQFGLAFTLH
jgi:hypothetical protein